MGYTHYYNVIGFGTPEFDAAWPKLVQDATRIIEAANVPLVGVAECDFDSQDESDDDENDTQREQHETYYPVPFVVDAQKGIFINGIGKDSHEPFKLPASDRHDKDPSHPRFRYVKTAGKPYDIVVACILLRAHRIAPTIWKFQSDGFWNEEYWKAPRRLYQQLWPEEELECPSDLEEEPKYTSDTEY